MYARADHSSPPMRTRPPSASTRSSTVARAPMSAAVPVRVSAGMRRCERAIGRRIASEATVAAMKTSTCAHAGTKNETKSAGSVASATGPRKKSPGVASSPSASRTARIAQITHAGTRTLGACCCCSVKRPDETECRRKASKIRQPLRMLRKPSLAVDEPRIHPDRTRPADVVVRIVAHHHRGLGGDVELLEHCAEDRLVRLRLAVNARRQHRVDCDAVMRDEDVEVAAGVGEEAELQLAIAQIVEHRQRVLEELEVVGALPRAGHLERAGVRVAGAAHPLDDPLREQDPDLLVVVELRVALQRRDRIASRLLVAFGDEVEAETRAEPAVALGAEIGSRLRESEVDVEDDRLQRHAASSSQRADSTWARLRSVSSVHATVCAIVQPRARSRSRPSSA